MIFNKKGQIQGQVFIYILTLIIAGVIFMFGYSAVSSFTGQIEQSKLIDFELDMNSVFDKLGSEYMSYEEHTFYLPGDYNQVCFADLSHSDFNDNNFMVDLEADNPLIYDMISSGMKDNVFIYSHWFEKSFNVGEIRIKEEGNSDYIAFKCYELFAGKLNIYIQGLGDAAEIEEVLPEN